MKRANPEDLSNLSLMELFRVEAENQTAIITSGLLELERNPGSTHQLEALMRAAHSLKGAARIVNQSAAVTIAHAIEDCFVAVQQGKIQLQREQIDVLFQGVDLLLQISKSSGEEIAHADSGQAEIAQPFLAALTKITAGNRVTGAPSESALSSFALSHVLPPKNESSERVLRLTAQNLNRLLGLCG